RELWSHDGRLRFAARVQKHLRRRAVRPSLVWRSTRKSEMGILKGKVAVVTGSTSGIDLAYARAFAGAGANIVLNGMGAPADVEKERSAIESDFGVKAVYSPADMAEPNEIAELITLGEKTFGSVDILVNNAGVQHVAPIEEFPVDKWNAIIGINLSSA